jgi:hypothetical protein
MQTFFWLGWPTKQAHNLVLLVLAEMEMEMDGRD